MSPPSKPDLIRSESLAELYPNQRDNTTDALRDLIVKHARKHDQHVSTFIAHTGRISEVEEKVSDLDKKDDALSSQITQLGAEIKQEIAVAKGQVKAVIATITVVWGILAVLIGIAAKILLTSEPDPRLPRQATSEMRK